MKKFVVVICLLAVTRVTAQWSIVGDPGISNPYSSAQILAMAVDTDGVPFLLHVIDTGFVVKKFDGSAWVQVGDQFRSKLGASRISMKLWPDNVPFVYCREFGKTYNSLLKLVNNKWQLLDSLNLPPASYIAYPNSMDIDSAGNIYLAVTTGSNGVGRVYKFNGVNWQILGPSGLLKSAYSVKVSRSGTPYVFGLVDNFTGVIMKYNGATWDTFGRSFGVFDMVFTDLAFSSKDSLHYTWTPQNQNPVVKKWNGINNWQTVGGAINTTGFAQQHVSLLFSSKDSLYIGFQRGLYNGQSPGVALKLNGQSWEHVGGYLGFTPYDALGVQLVMDKHDNIYASFSDLAISYYTTLMKYTQPYNNVTSGLEEQGDEKNYLKWNQHDNNTVLFNSKDEFSRATYKVYDVLGNLVAQGNFSGNSFSVVMQSNPTGTYIAVVTGNQQTFSTKFIWSR